MTTDKRSPQLSLKSDRQNLQTLAIAFTNMITNQAIAIQERLVKRQILEIALDWMILASWIFEQEFFVIFGLVLGFVL